MTPAASEPLVDVVIAAHSVERRVDRAVDSVLRNRAAVRVTVVSHNLPPESLATRLGDARLDPRVRLVAHRDGIPSPSGPFNHGLDVAAAPFVSIMGSDDELEPGAIDSWLRLAEAHRADVVITRLRFASGRPVPTPPVRRSRSRNLDAVRDRLAYRSAPLGLMRASSLGSLRLSPGMRNGGDLAFVTALWFSDRSISYDRSGPAYVIHDDATDRVTLRTKSIAEELAWLPALLASPHAKGLDRVQRRSLAAKLIRRHLVGSIDNRPDPAEWSTQDLADLADAFRLVLEYAPEVTGVLSPADVALLREASASTHDPTTLIRRSVERRAFPRWATARPSRLRYALDPEAPLNLALAQRRVLRDGAARSR